jgi:ferrous iron transport protein A
MPPVVPLSTLREGQEGIIVNLGDAELALKLMEMGMLPGERVIMEKKAPLGDPISFRLQNALLSIRKKEAVSISVEVME